jgi:hypothetical protein
MRNLFSGHTVCPLTDAALPTNGVLSLALEYEFPSSCNSLKKNHSYPSPSTPDAPLFVPPFIVIAAPRPKAMQDSKKTLIQFMQRKTNVFKQIWYGWQANTFHPTSAQHISSANNFSYLTFGKTHCELIYHFTWAPRGFPHFDQQRATDRHTIVHVY